MSDALHEVAALVLRESGMVIRESQLPALAAAIGRIQPGMTPEHLLREMARPDARHAYAERLIDEVTVKETYFLRHRDELEAIDWRELAAHAMAAGRHTVRVWSAACASGEEPYSLAMLALEAFAPGHPPVDILATDIAPSSIARAEAGRYGWRSVRHVGPTLRARWFEADADGLTVGITPRSLVRFARHNLLHDPIPPAGEHGFDLIVCRNVLIYFEPDAVRRTIERLHDALLPTGRLVLGAADRLTGPPPTREAKSEQRQASDDARAPRTPRRAGSAPARQEHRGATPRSVKPRSARAGADPAPPPTREPGSPPPTNEPDTEPETDYHDGLEALADGNATQAVEKLRRALYLDPANAPAAFQLGRAHEANGDPAAARRAYWQALQILETAEDEVGGVARVDLQQAARSRLDSLPAD